MLKIVPIPAGLTFNDWQDVLHEATPEDTLPDYRRDDLREEEIHYLDIEFVMHGVKPLVCSAVRQLWPDEPIPRLVRHARGVGNWKKPKVAIITHHVDCNCSEASPKWGAFRAYARLRPFSTNEKSRKFLYKLCEAAGLAPEDIYLTAAVKDWMVFEQSVDTCKAELELVQPQKIICLGNDTSIHMKKWVRQDILTLRRPEFWTSWHGADWKHYRENFARLVQQ